MKIKTFHHIERLIDHLIEQRVWVVVAVAALTAVMGALAIRVPVKTVFEDLLPQNHPYIQVNKKFAPSFGGSNMVSIMLEVEKGDIFNLDVLGRVQQISQSLSKVDAVDPYQIVSLASKKVKEIRASTEGIESRPLMWPDVPKSDAELALLRESVLNNPLVYGAYVSADLKSTLITVDFYDHLLDYTKAFEQIGAIVEAARAPGIKVGLVGEPILYGLVNHYLPETAHIFLLTVAALAALLLLITRTVHGTLLPLCTGTVSALVAMGAADLMGFHLDPLVIVVVFLITALAISNSVQIINRFDDELAGGSTSAKAAARAALTNLLKPSLLAIVADAGCVIVVALTPIPILQKISYIGTVWIFSIVISSLVLTPVLLSWVSERHRRLHPVNVMPVVSAVLKAAFRVATSRGRYVVLGGVVVAFVASAVYSFNLTVGDANPGSPILWPDSDYNLDAAAINDKFRGSDRMFVVVSGEKEGALKEPEVLETVARFQRYMEAQPEVGGTVSLVDVLPIVRRIAYEGNPRYAELGKDANENGELLFMFVSGSDPGDLQRFADPYGRNGSVTLYFRDHKGETIRTAVARIKQYIAENPLPNAAYQLAGGLIGVLAAANEVILAGQIEAIALALLVLVICCSITYRSLVAGIFFMVPVLLSNALTFSYMAWQHIGMNVNTLPVVALGIGLGVDYSFYIVDGIRENLRRGMTIEDAIGSALMGAGRGVLITAVTLITSVIIWVTSSVRLQADMGLLIGMWLSFSAFAALFVMPAIVYVFRPAFVVSGSGQEVERADEPLPQPM